MPRKTPVVDGDEVRIDAASMRPRPDAAENISTGERRWLIRSASMRPRPDAAENPRQNEDRMTSPVCFNEAAARCRGKRPTASSAETSHRGCFNEAAARCRGKPEPGLRAAKPRLLASMRPRPDAAENARLDDAAELVNPRFNEAAARCRGKPGQTTPSGRRRRGFNEAAARCRGKRTWPARTSTPRRCGFNEAAARCRGKRRGRAPRLRR